MVTGSKPVMTVELREGAQTDYGTPQPVVIVEFDERMHLRTCEAFQHILAAALSMRSLSERWIVQIGGVMSQGQGRPQRAILKMELADGSREEAARCIAMLERAVVSIAKDKNVDFACYLT